MALGLSVVLFLFSDPAPAQPPAGLSQRQGTDSTAPSADEVIARFRQEWKAEKGHMRPLDDRGWKARMTALKGLVRLGPEAVAPLVRALDDEDAELRVFAAHALGFVGDARAAKRLERTLAEDQAPAARLHAADSLGMIGGLPPKPLFERIEAQNSSKDVRAHMRFALERKGEALPEKMRENLRDYDLTRLDTAEVGKTAPDFTLTDALGQSYRLSDFRGKKAVVLLFIYGDT
jgi:HEAT repeat protein